MSKELICLACQHHIITGHRIVNTSTEGLAKRKIRKCDDLNIDLSNLIPKICNSFKPKLNLTQQNND